MFTRVQLIDTPRDKVGGGCGQGFYSSSLPAAPSTEAMGGGSPLSSLPYLSSITAPSPAPSDLCSFQAMLIFQLIPLCK